MPQVHRLTDENTAGAPITHTAQSTVYANNLLIGVNDSNVAGHGPGVHAGPLTANGSTDVFIENIPVNRKDDKDTCGHPRDIGSPDVFANGG